MFEQMVGIMNMVEEDQLNKKIYRIMSVIDCNLSVVSFVKSICEFQEGFSKLKKLFCLVRLVFVLS